MSILLLIIIAIFALCFFIGYKKGLVKIVASLVATFVIIFLVSMISPHVSTWIREATPLEDVVQEQCTELFAKEEDIEETLEVDEPSKDEQISMIENTNLPEIFQQMLKDNNNYEIYDVLGVTTFVEYVGAYIAKLIADIIAFLISMIVVTIVVNILIKMLGIIGKLPVIGGVNHLAGGVAGIGIGIIVVWILLIVVTLMYDTAFGKMCFEDITNNSILKTLYDSNLLMQYITKF